MFCHMKVFHRIQVENINKLFIFVPLYRFEKSLCITLNEEIWAGWMLLGFRQGFSSGKIYQLTIDQHHSYTYSCLDLLPCKTAWHIIMLFNWIEHQLTWWLIFATCVIFSVTSYCFLPAASCSPQLSTMITSEMGFPPSLGFCLTAFHVFEKGREMEKEGGGGKGKKIHLTITITYNFWFYLLVIRPNKGLWIYTLEQRKPLMERKTKRKDL